MDIAHGSEIMEIVRGLVYASSTADTQGAAINMEGWDGCIFILDVATIAGGTGYLKVQQDTVTGMGSAADLEGSAKSFTATGVYYVDVYRPREQFLRGYIDRDTSNAIAASLICIKYRGAKAPISLTNGKRLISPAEGTA